MSKRVSKMLFAKMRILQYASLGAAQLRRVDGNVKVAGTSSEFEALSTVRDGDATLFEVKKRKSRVSRMIRRTICTGHRLHA